MFIKKYTLRSAWIIVLFLSPALLWAQNEPYHGGFGGGNDDVSSSLTACNNFRFAGSFGKGDSSAQSSLLNCSSFRFEGGFGDGDSSAKSSLLNCSSFRFGGGFGAGDSSVQSSLLNCNTFRFGGDTADGSANAKTSLLNCNIFRFSGDSADGTANGIALKIRDFLGSDTSITLICTNETFNLLSLYNTTGLTVSWGTSTPAIAGLGTYTITAATPSGCRDTAVTVIKQEIARWTGTISNNWHTAGNWSNNKVPDEKTNVIIPGGTPNPCQISTANATAATVQARASNSFSIINNRVLLVSGTCTVLPPN